MKQLLLLTLTIVLWASTAIGQGPCPDGNCDTWGNEPAPSRRLRPRQETPIVQSPQQGQIATRATGKQRSICRIRSVTGKGPGEYQCGSGALIGKGRDYGVVVTAGHVFEPKPSEVFCQFAGRPNHVYRGEVFCNTLGDWGADLAFIKLDERPSEPVITIAANPPVVGDILTLAGYGCAHEKNEYREASGKLSRYFQASRGKASLNQFSMTTDARDGDSGGPVFDMSGQLVGVLWGGYPGETVATFNGQIHEITQLSGKDRYQFPWNRDNAATGDLPLPTAPGRKPSRDDGPVDVGTVLGIQDIQDKLGTLDDLVEKVDGITDTLGVENPKLKEISDRIENVENLFGEGGELKVSLTELKDALAADPENQSLKDILTKIKDVAGDTSAVATSVSELQVLPAGVKESMDKVAKTAEAAQEKAAATSLAVGKLHLAVAWLTNLISWAIPAAAVAFVLLVAVLPFVAKRTKNQWDDALAAKVASAFSKIAGPATPARRKRTTGKKAATKGTR